MATTYDFNADTITRLRDEEFNSWAKIAEALNLGSPGSARRAYTALVRPHTDSILPHRSPSGGNATPVDLAGSDKPTIATAIEGSTIVVQRRGRTEDIRVVRVTSVREGTVNLNDGDKYRAVKSDAILAVR